MTNSKAAKMVRLNIKIPSATKERIRRAAEAHDMDMSKYASTVLIDHIDGTGTTAVETPQGILIERLDTLLQQQHEVSERLGIVGQALQEGHALTAWGVLYILEQAGCTNPHAILEEALSQAQRREFPKSERNNTQDAPKSPLEKRLASVGKIDQQDDTSRLREPEKRENGVSEKAGVWGMFGKR